MGGQTNFIPGTANDVLPHEVTCLKEGKAPCMQSTSDTKSYLIFSSFLLNENVTNRPFVPY